MRRLLERKDDGFYQGFLTPLEIASALYRRLRSQDISQDELSILLRAYIAHSHPDYILIPYSAALIDRASALVARQVLSALDAIELATALALTACLLCA